MTVKELITTLGNLPPDLPVKVLDWEGEWSALLEVEEDPSEKVIKFHPTPR